LFQETKEVQQLCSKLLNCSSKNISTWKKQ
jgi:hypothetical protein